MSENETSQENWVADAEEALGAVAQNEFQRLIEKLKKEQKEKEETSATH